MTEVMDLFNYIFVLLEPQFDSSEQKGSRMQPVQTDWDPFNRNWGRAERAGQKQSPMGETQNKISKVVSSFLDP